MSEGGKGRRVIISYRQDPRVKISTWNSGISGAMAVHATTFERRR